jgi:hypothetical protein
MADQKLSALPVATTPSGTELIYLVQGGVSKQSTVSAIASTSTPTLQQVLTAGSTLVGNNTITGIGDLTLGTDDPGVYTSTIKTSGSTILYTSDNGVNTGLFTQTPTNNTFTKNVTALSFTKSGGTSSQFLKADGSVDSNVYGVGDALTTNPLSQFAATTSSQLASVISDETGTGALVFGTSPTFTTSVTINGALVQNTYSTIGSNGYGGYFAATTGATNNYAAGFNGRVSQEGLGSSTFFGFMCGVKDDLTTNLNTGFGASALLTNIVGTKNCAFGYFSLRLTTGSFNVGFGTETLYSNTTGAQNVAIGTNALFSNQTGAGNTAVGDLSLFQTTGGSNTGVGKNTLYDHTSGTFNTAIGWNTGRGIITGGSNTIIGAQVTGLSSTLANNVIIADGAGNKVLWFNSANALISDLKIDTTTGIKIATATTQKLSFWNATPIVQPTTAVAAATVVSGTGGNVKHDDTFDGYTVEQVVRALRTIGLLA